MDDNAQTSSLQQAPEPSIAAQPVSNQPSPAIPQQQVARVVEPPGKQSISGGHPEQGSRGAYAANEDYDDNDDDDEQPVAKQEVSNVKMSHPEVVMPQEVKDAGVTEGKDAKAEDLPEEKQEVEETVTQASAVQSTTQQAGDPTLPMSLGEAQLAVKKERSIKNGISWIIRLVIREWKKRMFNESTNQQIN